MMRPFWLRFVWARSLWLPLVPALIGIWLTVVSDAGADRAQLLAVYGLAADAEVTNRDRREQRDSEGRVTDVTWWVAVRFFTEGGHEITRRVAVSQGYFDAATVGDNVPLTYLPDDPAILELEPGRTEAASRSSRIAAMGAWAIAVVSGLWLWRQNAPAIRAAGRGDRVTARIITHVPQPTRKARRPQVRLNWRDETGAEGKSGPLSPEEVRRYPVGGTVVLCVDPVTGQRFWCRDLGLAG